MNLWNFLLQEVRAGRLWNVHHCAGKSLWCGWRCFCEVHREDYGKSAPTGDALMKRHYRAPKYGDLFTRCVWSNITRQFQWRCWLWTGIPHWAWVVLLRLLCLWRHKWAIKLIYEALCINFQSTDTWACLQRKKHE